jgi:hypothetical protein
MSKRPKYLSNCLAKTETNVVPIVFDCVLCEVLSYAVTVSYKNKENVTFTWATGVQNVLFFTIAGDKFVLGYFRVLKSPYLRIGT